MSSNKKSASKKNISEALCELFLSLFGEDEQSSKEAFSEAVQAEDFQEKLTELIKKHDKKNKPKKLKDPNAPKKPVNGYIRFSQEKRATVKEENPEMKGAEITKKLAEMWKALSDKKKEKYNSKYKTELDSWKEEMKGYEAPSTEELQKLPENRGRVPGAKRKKKDPNEPKRPKNAYQFFCEDKRDDIKEENPDASPADVMRLLGEAWKEVKDNEKKVKKYKKKADAAKEEYAQKMKKYKAEKESGDEVEEAEEKPKKSKKKSEDEEAEENPEESNDE